MTISWGQVYDHIEVNKDDDLPKELIRSGNAKRIFEVQFKYTIKQFYEK